MLLPLALAFPPLILPSFVLGVLVLPSADLGMLRVGIATFSNGSGSFSVVEPFTSLSGEGASLHGQNSLM